MYITGYELIEYLGDGAYGEVYKARNPKGKLCALKIVYYEDIGNVINETHMAYKIAEINSPYFVKLYDSSKKGDKVIYEYEFVDGVTLEQLQEELGVIDEKTASIMIREVLKGLNTLHHNGIIHHDVKLENIMIDTDSNIRIIDYGLSDYVDYGSTIKKISTVGTPLYMSAELLGCGIYDHGVDIWACGIALYKLLTDNFPFDPKEYNIEALHRTVIAHKITFPDDVSEDAKRVIKWMLTTSVTNRPSAEELLKDPFFY